jgi:hypothetical protein
MKSKLILALATLFFLLLNSHESFAQPKNKKKKAEEEERFNPKFSYSPPTSDTVGSAGVTIALLNPIFLNKDIQNLGSPFRDFAKAMADDIDELLTSKGFKVRGPFSSFDEMVVSDKFSSDFILQITIDIEPNTVRKWQTIMQLLSNANLYRVSQGDVSLNGKVKFTALSCFSKEKLWTKNIDLIQKKFSYTGSIKWPTNNVNQITELNQDVNLWNPVCKTMEEYYKEAFDILYKQFEKSEMVSVAELSKKTDKDRKGN